MKLINYLQLNNYPLIKISCLAIIQALLDLATMFLLVSYLNAQINSELLIVNGIQVSEKFALLTILSFLSARLILSTFIIYYQNLCVENLLVRIRKALFKLFLKNAKLRFTNDKEGKIFTSIGRTSEIFAYGYVGGATRCIVDLLVIVLIFTALIVKVLTLTILFLIFVSVLASIYLFVLNRNSAVYGRSLNTLIEEIVWSADRVVKAFRELSSTRLKFFLNKFEHDIAKYGVLARNFRTLNIAPKYLIDGFIYIFIVLYINLYTSDIISRDLNFEVIAFALFSFIRLAPLLFSLLQNLNQMRNSQFAFDELKEIDVVLQHDQSTPEVRIIHAPNLKDNFGINLYFPSKKEIALSPNKIYALVGKSGSGKSTLLDKIFGLHVLSPIIPTLKQKNIKSKLSIEYTQQEPLLFSGSLSDNILFGETNNLQKASELISELLPEFVGEPLTMQISDNGVSVSGGQKKRIALVRSLLAEQDIWLIDEVLVGLDEGIKKSALEAIREKENCIVILVTHDPDVMDFCDEVIEIDEICNV